MRALVLCPLLALLLGADPIKDYERQRLISHLKMTEAWLENEIKGLTPAQQSFRASKDSWSILDVLDHLAVAEPHYWKTLKDSLSNPAPPENSGVTDAPILWYGIDRTQRNKTAESREPKGSFKSASEAFASFRTLRAEMLDFAQATQEDLRAHRYLESKMDLYQWFVMISAHAQRHILQIREIKSTPGYPR